MKNFIGLIFLIFTACTAPKYIDKSVIPSVVNPNIEIINVDTSISQKFQSDSLTIEIVELALSSSNDEYTLEIPKPSPSLRKRTMRSTTQREEITPGVQAENFDRMIKTNPSSAGKKTSNVRKQIVTKQEENEDDDIELGRLAYHVPDTMIVKKTYIIRIRLSRDTNIANISSGLENPSVEKNIKTSSRMEVEISDPSPEDRKSFSIVKSNEDVQLIESEGYTEWVWGVTPLKSGKLQLNVVVSIIKGEDKKQVVYFDEVIVESNIGADVKDFISKYWQWLMTTVVIPLVVWFYNKRKKQNDNKV